MGLPSHHICPLPRDYRIMYAKRTLLNGAFRKWNSSLFDSSWITLSQFQKVRVYESIEATFFGRKELLSEISTKNSVLKRTDPSGSFVRASELVNKEEANREIEQIKDSIYKALS